MRGKGGGFKNEEVDVQNEGRGEIYKIRRGGRSGDDSDSGDCGGGSGDGGGGGWWSW
jgi:hypothetical protein